MKAETKAKRRATLGLLGLGMTDESELDTIPAAAMSAAQPIDVTVRRDDGVPPKALVDAINAIAKAPTIAAAQKLAREASSPYKKGTVEYQQLLDTYNARVRELEASGPKPPSGGGSPTPESGTPANDSARGEVITGEHEPADGAQAWTEATWRAHVEQHAKHFAVANSYAKHETALEAAGVKGDEIAIERLIALGLDESHAVEAIAAACQRRDKKAAA
jgi:hypothetical protein